MMGCHYDALVLSDARRQGGPAGSGAERHSRRATVWREEQHGLYCGVFRTELGRCQVGVMCWLADFIDLWVGLGWVSRSVR